MKTPIRNPIFNTKAHRVLEQIIPAGSVVSSYGFYSGDLEFYLSERKRFIIGNTEKDTIYDVWLTFLESPWAASEIASRILPIDKEKEFPILQETWYKYKNPDVRAALFYFLNNCSDSGYISKGEMDTTNYNPISLSRLKKFTKPNNFHIQKIEDTIQSVRSQQEAEINLLQLPKYIHNFLSQGINRGIEETNIDFRELAKAVQNRKFVIVTQPSPFLKKMFDCKMIFINEFGRKVESEKAKEVILHNVR